ncbi:MAG: hypothetical protein HWE27_18395 [Gammaproteobacteria bacterium]|nr:hypothetical protein [Gammaproteobacteria bacterium]
MQQINLYLPEFKPKKEVLNFSQLGLAALASALLFSAYGWFLGSQTDFYSAQLVQEKAMIEPLERQKAELDKLLAERPDESRVDLRLSRLELDIANKALALQTLKNSDISASSGFSNLIGELAKPKNNRIWFTEIALNQDILSLKGQTLEPELITKWIEQSGESKTLMRQFSTISIEENENNDRVFDFELANGKAVSANE